MPARERGLFEMPPGSNCWWIQFFDSDHRRRREKVGSLSAARELLTKRRNQRREGIKLPENLRVRGVPFGTLLDDALTYSRANNGQRSTAQLEGKFAEFRAEFGGRDASAIKRPEIVAWLANQSEERGWAAATRNRWQAAWSLVFSVAIENDKLSINPASKIRRKPEQNGRMIFIHKPDEEKRLSAIVVKQFPSYVPAVQLALHTGIRASEQWRLVWADVDLERRDLRVSATKNGDPERHVPLNAVAIEALKAQKQYSKPKSKAPVFVDSEEIQISDCRDWFVPCVQKAKLPEGFTWHCLRHSFASRLVMSAVDIRTVAQLMGHRTLQMTMRYAHLAPDHQQDAVDRIATNRGAIRTATKRSQQTNKKK